MLAKKTDAWRILLIMLVYIMINASAVHAVESKVLVVMSYEQNNPWCMEKHIHRCTR